MANHNITDTATYRHFAVRIITQLPGRKTQRYMVQGFHSCNAIAYIWWYAPWRQYCFYPGPETVWSFGCLADIQDFLDKLNERKKK